MEVGHSVVHSDSDPEVRKINSAGMLFVQIQEIDWEIKNTSGCARSVLKISLPLAYWRSKFLCKKSLQGCIS